MKNKKHFTLIELIIVIVVIGTLAAMALPKFNGVIRDAKISAMINDKEVLEKALIMYYQKNDELPLLNEDEELIVKNEGMPLTKIVLAEEAQNGDMDTIYKSLKETLNHYSDSEENLYRIDLSKIKDNLGKDIKHGHKKHDKDFYVYSTKTGNVYYYDALINGNGTLQHSEYDTLLKNNELVAKTISPSLNEDKSNNEDNISIKNNTIALGSGHTMRIGKDGNLYTWGLNSYGQLGIGSKTDKLTLELVTLPNEVRPKSIFTKSVFSMAIGEDGNLYSWGGNFSGQLGLGDRISKTTPQLVTFPNGVKPTSIYLGDNHSMAIANDGNIYAWGRNDYGQLGLGNTIDQLIPQLVTLPNGVKPKFISLGSFHSMAIGDDGNLYTWGKSNFGQLGLGNTTIQLIPQKVTFPNNIKPKSIYTGSMYSMIIGNDDNIYGWGSNGFGQLGIGNTTNQLTPQKITLPNGVKPTSISLGSYHSMAIGDDENIYVWGYNNLGQLGIGNKINKLTPQLITLPNEEKPISIELGSYSSMVITNKNNLYAWGDNYSGQLGIGNTTNQLTPIKVELP